MRQEHLLDTAGASPGWVGGASPLPSPGEDHGETGTPAGHGGSVPGLGGWGLPSPLPGRGSRGYRNTCWTRRERPRAGWVGASPLPSPGERITVIQEHLLDTAGASPGWVGGGLPSPLPGREDHGETGTPAGHGGSVPGLGGWGPPLSPPRERVTVIQEHLLDTAGASPGWVGGGLPPPLPGRGSR